MRSSTPVILWILIFSFGVLWVLADTQFFDALQAGPRSLGSVNGEPISYEEYNSRISYYIDQYSQQTGNSVTPELRTYYEEQAWEDLVTSKLVSQKMDDLGINVTDQEVVNMITGENPDPFIRQQFQKEDGTIDRVALRAAIEAPENSQVWLLIEQQLRQKRRQQKLNNYVQSAMKVSEYEVEQQFIKNNTHADIAFVRFPFADLPDSTVNFTEADLEEYYQENRENYKRKEQYRFKYVSFDKTPTSEDTARVIKELKDARGDFAQAENDSLFLVRYQSETPYNDEFVDKGEIREAYQPVLELQDGEVSEVIMSEGQVHLLKKLDETRTQVKFVVLTLPISADPISTIDRKAEEAEDFSFFAEQDGFIEEAGRRELEVKEAFATKDNPFIAGLGQSRQILNYLEVADEGDLSEPIELSNEFIVLKVTEVIPAGYRPLEEVRSQVRNAVINEKRKEQIVEHTRTLIEDHETLEAIAEAAGKQVQTDDNVRMNESVIEGAGREPQIVGTVFGMSAGERSGVLLGNAAIFLLRVDSITEANLENLDSATRQKIRQTLEQQKSTTFSQVWMDQLKESADIVDNRDRLLQR